MEEINIVIRQVIMFVCIAVLGFIIGKKNYLPSDSGMVISRLVIKVTAPILILTTIVSYEFTPQMIMDGIYIYIYGVVFISFAFATSTVVCRFLRLDEQTKNIYKLHSTIGNVTYLGFPLLYALFGEKGIIYAVFYNMANETFLWTIGIYLLNKHNNIKFKDNLKKLINPNTICFFTGILIVFLRYNFSEYINNFGYVLYVSSFLYESFVPLGRTTAYLAMLFIGLILCEIEVKRPTDLLKKYPLFILTFAKLIFVPIVALIVLMLTGNLVDMFVRKILIIQVAMPCALIVTALAAQYESDYKFATEAVLVTTIAGIFTLPMIVYILNTF